MLIMDRGSKRDRLTPVLSLIHIFIIKEAVILMIVWFFFYKLSRYNGIPFVLVIMGVLVGLYHFITSKTVAGRQIYALGGNAKAAKLSGINTEKVFFWVYTNMGILRCV